MLTTKGLPTTAGSRMLQGWVPPYDATVVRELHAAGLVVLARRTWTSSRWARPPSTPRTASPRNPWDPTRIPGGSGGGSAAALAAFEAPLTIGSDTGGSIRQPAAVTGTVGVKPTYGAVSRYGLIALASSLDQAGPCARTVMDTALLHAVIAGHDPYDSTSLPGAVPDVVGAARQGATGDLTGVRIGVVTELSGEGYEPGVVARFEEALAEFRAAGAEVVELSLPNIVHALAAYYLILPSEASSNLAKFDGMRYGLRVVPDGENVTAETVMRATRAAGFGDEAKRRIILGTYALSAGYYDATTTAAPRRCARSCSATSTPPSVPSTCSSRRPRRRWPTRWAPSSTIRWRCTPGTSRRSGEPGGHPGMSPAGRPVRRVARRVADPRAPAGR